ncbi:hypothetical protein MRB53_038255 [Persea americana]|nr:hypothetical protein MRB53_038255 [Persea americana]
MLTSNAGKLANRPREARSCSSPGANGERPRPTVHNVQRASSKASEGHHLDSSVRYRTELLLLSFLLLPSSAATAFPEAVRCGILSFNHARQGADLQLRARCCITRSPRSPPRCSARKRSLWESPEVPFFRSCGYTVFGSIYGRMTSVDDKSNRQAHAFSLQYYRLQSGYSTRSRQDRSCSTNWIAY